jgi:hypothetical protein
MDRRGFLRFLSVAPVVATMPGSFPETALAVEPTPEAVGSFSSFTEIVTDTLRQYPSTILSSVTEHNALMRKLLKIELRGD